MFLVDLGVDYDIISLFLHPDIHIVAYMYYFIAIVFCLNIKTCCKTSV